MAGIGRPPLDPTKRAAWEIKRAERAAQHASKKVTVGAVHTVVAPEVKMTKEDMVKVTAERFNVLSQVARAAVMGGVRSVVVSGAGGVGKSYTIENIVMAAVEEYGINAQIYHAAQITPISLFKLLYENRSENDVIVMDDADSIFFDDKTLNLLKAALDTNKVRKVSWMSHSIALDGIPSTFEYCGTMIFVTNLPLHMMAAGNHKNAHHLAALMTRAMYIDLKLHTAAQIVAWIEYLVKKANILVAEHGLTKEEQTTVVEYLNDNIDNLRSVSIRTAIQIAGLMKTNPEEWKSMARVIHWK